MTREAGRRRPNAGDRGAALIWTLLLLVIAAVLLACILPLASGSMTNSRQTNYKQQAYYTAKSVVDMLVEYVSSDAQERSGISDSNQPVGYQILKRAKEAGAEGYNYTVDGIDDMGTCVANVSYKDNTLYIRATASYGQQTSTLTASMKLETGNDSFVSAASYISGIYPGIRANTITQTAEKDGIIKMTNSNILLTGQKDLTKEKSQWPVSNVLIQTLTGIRKEASPKLYSRQDLVNHEPITEAQEHQIRTVYASQSADSKPTELDGTIILDNLTNLFHVNTNVYVAGTNNAYNFYTSQLVKLSGQIEIGGGDMGSGMVAAMTVGKLILEGNDVDSTAEIGFLQPDGTGKYGGIESLGQKYYIDNGISIDHASITSGTDATRGVIFSDGPVFVKNTRGGTFVQFGAANTDYMVYGTAIDIQSTRASSLRAGQPQEQDNNRIVLGGTLTAIDLSGNFQMQSSVSAAMRPLLQARYANAYDSREDMAYQQLVAQYHEEQAKTGNTDYADETVLWNLKENYNGDIRLDATTVLDEAGNVQQGLTPAPIVVNGNRTNGTDVVALEARGNVSIAGNVTINGDIRASRNVTITEGAVINGNIISDGMVTISDGATINGNITAAQNVMLGSEQAERSVRVDGSVQSQLYINVTGDVTITGQLIADSVYLVDLTGAHVTLIGSRDGEAMLCARVKSEFVYRNEDSTVTQEETVSTNEGPENENTDDSVFGNTTILGPSEILVKYAEEDSRQTQYSGRNIASFNIPTVASNANNRFTSNTTFRNLLGTVFEEAESKYELRVEDYSSVLRSVKLSEIVNQTLEIDDRSSGRASRFYKIQSNTYRLKKLQLDSYGDTYFIVPANMQLSLDEITSKTYFSNLFFILEDNAVLKLNEGGDAVAMNVHVVSRAKENGAKLIVGDHTIITGSIDVDQVELGEDITFTYQQPNDLSGALAQGYNRWQVTQYTRD